MVVVVVATVVVLAVLAGAVDDNSVARWLLSLLLLLWWLLVLLVLSNSSSSSNSVTKRSRRRVRGRNTQVVDLAITVYTEPVQDLLVASCKDIETTRLPSERSTDGHDAKTALLSYDATHW